MEMGAAPPLLTLHMETIPMPRRLARRWRRGEFLRSPHGPFNPKASLISVNRRADPPLITSSRSSLDPNKLFTGRNLPAPRLDLDIHAAFTVNAHSAQQRHRTTPATQPGKLIGTNPSLEISLLMESKRAPRWRRGSLHPRAAAGSGWASLPF